MMAYNGADITPRSSSRVLHDSLSGSGYKSNHSLSASASPRQRALSVNAASDSSMLNSSSPRSRSSLRGAHSWNPQSPIDRVAEMRKMEALTAKVEEYRLVIAQISQKNKKLESRMAAMMEEEEERQEEHRAEVAALQDQVAQLQAALQERQQEQQVAPAGKVIEGAQTTDSLPPSPHGENNSKTAIVPASGTSDAEALGPLGAIKMIGMAKRMKKIIQKNISSLDLNESRRSDRIILCQTAFPDYDENAIATAVHKLEQDLKWQETHGSLFDDLCLARFDPKVDVQQLDKRVLGEFGREATVFICTMGDISEVLFRRGVYFITGLVVRMRRIMMGVLKLFPSAILIKTDDKKSFVSFESTADAVLAAHLMNLRLILYNENETNGDPDQRIELQYGIDVGPLLFIPHDYYGDAVNCASKLGEDSADHGELYMSTRAYDAMVTELKSRPSVRPLFDAFDFQDGQVEQSKVMLDYKNVVLKDAAPTSALQDLERWSQEKLEMKVTLDKMSEFSRVIQLVSNPDQDFDDIVQRVRDRWERQRVIFISDMSGFTRIVKAHGILHFLAMIYKMRSIVNPILEKYGGEVIKFEADNVFALFDHPTQAVSASLEAQAALYEYNRFGTDNPLDRDNAIKISVGIAYGPVVYVPEDEDVFGPTVDLCFDLGEDIAESGEVLVSQEMKDFIDQDPDNPVSYDFEERELEKGGVNLAVYNVTVAEAEGGA
eukprot:TRINITY_DN3755_c0_g2_i1.p1 TRINITY_DN3755_c0_g2~~TRINITY_DN3755_c0_g2_i1.p1  ORF type:complete len:719 (+),score=205.57 TRINITY_DN3755_c0_g2_i1:350-2506(+)